MSSARRHSSTYCVDWTRRFHGPAVCVVRPATKKSQPSRRVRPWVPMAQGGNTGLVGGSVLLVVKRPETAHELPVIVSTRRIAWVDPVDELSAQVSVGAGTTLGDVQRHARAAGWSTALISHHGTRRPSAEPSPPTRAAFVYSRTG